MITQEIKLEEWGLTPEIKEKAVEEKGIVGRVIEEHKGLYRVITEEGCMIGKPSGKLIYEATDKSDFPAVGDWVQLLRSKEVSGGEIGKAIISRIYLRKSKVSRKIAGSRYDEQIIATNMDYIAICMSINHDYNVKRLERYLALAWESGANPLIILTKVDLAEDLESIRDEVNGISFGLPVIEVSSVTLEGIEEISTYIQPGYTVGLIGSSGVGKSTLINTLVGEELQETGVTMDDDRGKHTTTFRRLMKLPNGAIIVDTPGMKEVGLLEQSEGLEEAFADILSLEGKCKFGNCQHKTEPQCAIKKAIQEGAITQSRYQNYLKLKKEAAYMERKRKLQKMKQENIKNRTKKRRK